ncbi:MAG: N-acetylneuraminate synthase family protein [Lentisphaerae bacterium]|nr:N-acetylneuraminate synthase family protein [Lentisphaerota bacterium]
MEFNKKIRIAGKLISEDSATFIIAEAGVNHNNDLDLAKEMIDIAAEAKADAVKFQTFKTASLIIPNIEKAPYQKAATGKKESQYEMLKKLEMDIKSFVELKNHCDKKGIIFLTTPFDDVSFEELSCIKLDAYKVSSTDITNIPFLKKVAGKKKPIILSTGMCYMTEIEIALKTIGASNADCILLQCTSNYPTPPNEVNLNVIRTFKEKFDMLVGFSDHTMGIGAAPYALPLGAKIIEKHFTVDNKASGPDHKASLCPNDLNIFVKTIREVEKYMGIFEKYPTMSEMYTRKSLQKCIVASVGIKAGETFSVKNLCAKRTGGKGISPIYFDNILGLKSSRNYKLNDIIEINE